MSTYKTTFKYSEVPTGSVITRAEPLKDQPKTYYMVVHDNMGRKRMLSLDTYVLLLRDKWDTVEFEIVQTEIKITDHTIQEEA